MRLGSCRLAGGMRRFVSSPPRPNGMNIWNGRSIAITLSASFPDTHRNRRTSFPTRSTVSRRGVPRCRFATFSAAGCIVSRRWRHIRTMETFTGAEKPAPGRISTLPAILGCKRGSKHVSVNQDTCDSATVRLQTESSLVWSMRHKEGRGRGETYQGCGDAGIAHQEAAVRWTGYPHGRRSICCIHSGAGA